MDPVSAAAVASTAGTAGTAATLGMGASAASAAAAASTAAAGGFTFGTTAAASGGLFSGMSMGSLMSYASLGTSVLSGMQQASAYKTSAELEARGMQAQAFQEQLKAGEESIQRRERLLKALASQSVEGGAAGVSGGSAEALQLQSVQDFEREQRSADLMAQTQQDIYRRKIGGTLKSGGQKATGALLTTATELASIG